MTNTARWLALGTAAAALALTGFGTAQPQQVGVKVKGKVQDGARHQHDIKVAVNGDRVTFADVGPRMMGSRVLVPMRGVFEHMGASVNWDREQNKVTANRGGTVVELPIGKSTATVDGRQITLDQPAIVINGRAMVPLRFLSESLGAEVDWISSQMLVEIRVASPGF